LLAKNRFFVSVWCVFNVFVDHGNHWGNSAQALAQWRHPVASSAARDVLHWAMRLASYRCIDMLIEITSTSPAFFAVINSVVTLNRR
jgi:hypothetical protein